MDKRRSSPSADSSFKTVVVTTAFVCLFIGCLGCRPNPPAVPVVPVPCTDYRKCGVTFESMQELLSETESKIRDNWVQLPFAPAKTIQEKGYTVISSGETAKFSCPANNSSQELIWTHQGRRLPYVRRYNLLQENLTDVGFMYSFALDKTTQQMHFFVHDARLSAAGKIECLQACGENGNLCAMQTFTLQVRPSSSDIFEKPLENQSVGGPDDATFVCPVHGRYSIDEIRKRIIWRFNRRIVYAYPEHPFYILSPYGIHNNAAQHKLSNRDLPLYGLSSNLKFSYSVSFFLWNRPVSGSFLTISNVTLDSPGRVECWHQVYPENDEWLINSAYLTNVI